MELNQKQKNLLKELMEKSAERGNLANAGLVIENGKTIASDESLVASNYDATDHSERMLVSEVCRIKESHYTPGLTMVTVVEPCLMCMSACSQAGYKELAYIIPAKKYLGKVPYITDIKENLNKNKIAESFIEPIKLIYLSEYREEFSELFEELMVI
ncbi:MAG: hypothetical protein GTN40_01180 [Candidatus Aenigmarchaeota archaeon]|nr:hypothetical protein [Candidatus Aenigmarchaeota archaeon]